MSSATIIDKISTGAVGCPGAIAKIKGQKTYLMRVFGEITGTEIITIEEGKNKGQSFTALRGSLEAVNLLTGEVFQSGLAYFPKGAHELFVDMANSLAEDEVVQVGFDLYAVPSQKENGFSYGAEILDGFGDKLDKLSHMRKAMPPLPGAVAQPAIAAPDVIEGTLTKK